MGVGERGGLLFTKLPNPTKRVNYLNLLGKEIPGRVSF